MMTSLNVSPNADLMARGLGLVSGLATGALVVLRQKQHARSQGPRTSQHSASVDGEKIDPTLLAPDDINAAYQAD